MSNVRALKGIILERLPTAEARLARLAELSTLYVALPGSLISAISLYRTWVKGGGGAGRKPVVFYDRNGAFKVVRGYAADVIVELDPPITTATCSSPIRSRICGTRSPG